MAITCGTAEAYIHYDFYMCVYVGICVYSRPPPPPTPSPLCSAYEVVLTSWSGGGNTLTAFLLT